jgi:F0F1-type ATP synthase assembly protein I
MFGMPLILGAVMLILNFSLDNVGSSGWQVALLYITGTVICLNPAATALYTQYLLVNQRTYTTFSYQLSNGEKIQLVSPWIPFLLLYAILTIMFFALAVRRVRKIEE